MTAAPVLSYLARWHLAADGAVIETTSSWLVPVIRDRSAAMLKIYKPLSDERGAATLLRYWNGDGAVHLWEADDNAVLLERASGPRSLAAMVLAGADLDAAEILAQTIARLHARRSSKAPSGLTPLAGHFSSLYARERELAILGRCAVVARGLLAAPSDVVPLHGDLHHANVLDGGPRGWLAIDPKALLGERTYDVANLLCNPSPHGDLVHRPARMRRLAELYADRLGLDVRRVLGFALAHAGLSACWDIDDGCDPTFGLRCADVLNPLVQ